MGSNIDIMTYFVRKMFTKKPTEEEKRLIINTINQLLIEGFSEREIQLTIDKHKRIYGYERNIAKVFKNVKPGDNKNILTPGTFYYHSELRLAPEPPVAHYNEETRNIEHKYEDYYLEMQASYTMKELIEYYCNAMGLSLNDNRIKRYSVIFNNLLDSYSIDEILFTIDAAADIRKTNGLRSLTNPFILTDYMDIGEQNMALKASLSKQQGVDKIVYRKRQAIFDN